MCSWVLTVDSGPSGCVGGGAGWVGATVLADPVSGHSGLDLSRLTLPIPRFLLTLDMSSYFHRECGNHSLRCVTAFQNMSTHTTSLYCDESWLGLAGPLFQAQDLRFRQADSCKAAQKTEELEAALPPILVFSFSCVKAGYPSGGLQAP